MLVRTPFSDGGVKDSCIRNDVGEGRMFGLSSMLRSRRWLVVSFSERNDQKNSITTLTETCKGLKRVIGSRCKKMRV